jgi:hypothetical protein
MNTRFFGSGGDGAFLSKGHWVLVVCCLSLVSARAQAPSSSQRAVLVSRATDVVQKWQPGQRLYVKGEVGATVEVLNDLEQWLATNAPNWVVVLAEHAQGETYTDAAGEVFQGVEAVNHALGKGLMNRTAFGQQTDPRTGERNGAFFLLFLKERRLSYYGSDAQDRRGLGEESWIGNLDKAAIVAMRNGARVVDAAKDTITLINSKLDQRIAAEGAAREKQAADLLAAQSREREQARAALVNARAEYNLLEARAGELSRTFNGMDGDLARPDLPGLAAELKLAQTAFDQDDAAAALRGAERVRSRAGELIRRIGQYSADASRIEALDQRLRELQRLTYAGAATAQFRAARDSLAAVRNQYQHGNSGYAPLLDTASQTVDAAGFAVTMAERLAKQRQILWIMFLIAAVSLASVAGLLLNRRRLPAKTEARRLFDLWETALGEKTLALFSLLDRRATVIGTSAGKAGERFTGETLEVCEQVIRDVDELFILSACAGRVLQEARGQIYPDEVSIKLINLFRRGPYQRAVALLKDSPIAFRPEEGLELVVRGARTERDRLIGSVDSYQPFTMTFNALIDAFNEHAQRALSALDRVEGSLLKAPDEFQAVQRQIDSARSAEASLSENAADGLFLLTPVFDDLLPAAQQALSEALAKGIRDPVGALRKQGARARMQSDAATALVALAAHARQSTIPAACDCAGALEKSGLKAGWIGDELQRLSAEADHAAALALRESAIDEIALLTTSMKELEQRSRRAVAINEARSGPASEQMAQSTTSIAQTRAEIGTALGLTAERILREAGKDPTASLAQAREQWNAISAALERGDLNAAQSSLDGVKALTSEANAIVTASREAFSGHAVTLDLLRKELGDVTGLIPVQARTLSEIQAGYAPSVLALGAGDLAHPNANGTLVDNIQEAENHVAAVRELLERSVASYREARLLEAIDLLDQSRGLLDTARHRLLEITEKKSRLEAAVAANTSQLGSLERRAQECAALAAEPSTMEPTLRAFEEARHALADARIEAREIPGDPFVAATKLADAEAKHVAMADLARRDRDLFEQAGRSLAAAANRLRRRVASPHGQPATTLQTAPPSARLARKWKRSKALCGICVCATRWRTRIGRQLTRRLPSSASERPAPPQPCVESWSARRQHLGC